MGYNTLTKAMLVAGLALGMSSFASAADKPKLMMGASDTMLSNTCAGCHGTNGSSIGPATPNIAGASTEYFVEVMKGFKSGDIPSTIMGRIAQGYSDEEIETMGKFFAGQPYMATKQDFNADAVKQGGKLHDKYCEKCHAEGGSSAEDDSGILAGQPKPYLQWTLEDVLAGKRGMPKKMVKKLKKMHKKEGDAGMAALLDFYASAK